MNLQIETDVEKDERFLALKNMYGGDDTIAMGALVQFWFLCVKIGNLFDYSGGFSEFVQNFDTEGAIQKMIDSGFAIKRTPVLGGDARIFSPDYNVYYFVQ